MFKFILSGIALTLLSISPALADMIVLRSAEVGHYVGTDGAGRLALVESPAQALELELVPLESTLVAFRAADGQYLRAGVGENTHLMVTSPHIRGWETFQRIRASGGRTAFLSSQNGKYLTIDLDGRLSATAPHITEREIFTLEAKPRLVINPNVSQWLGNSGNPAAAQPPAQAAQPPVAANESHLYEGFYKIAQLSNGQGVTYQLPSRLYHTIRMQILGTGGITFVADCTNFNGRLRISGHDAGVDNLNGPISRCDGQMRQIEEDTLLALTAVSRFAGSTGGGDLYFFDASNRDVLVLRPTR
ncbi:MAG: hypothetical protein KIT02_10640 [Devosia sp.]|uniref:fascin domain-containing protein n=1 Tax=Devosia sp. TaxID=1871048 RepID=UPI0024CA6D3E|nr:hypothetical protein [Devosia sp.]UYN98415.1 MAG: hypothetical protein KIT02_10640 [Devosia sp.]